ncbi:DUF935 domain-containing protein [Grimontia kaedaensis]|uniref:DUF935 domain-containing protein n=1 Tax=Grimontia kaedaensis TaxID=2872157 RepID=A0ABY4WNL8_9GAMM|nr:DUF935 domain-containing protein [Grimontia kaedaensis]USH01094.1 DUF935 domain-containing protein [Grimontia kaedaensis]
MVKTQTLTREIAGPTAIRNPWGSGSAASGLTPSRLAAILQAASEGDLEAYLTLAEEMEERDPHYSSVMRTRKLAVAGLPVNIEAGGEDSHAEKLADAVRAMTEAPQFGELVDNALDALGKGFSVNEIMWDRSGRQWTPSAYLWRDPRYFQFNQKRPDELRLQDERDPVDGIVLPPYKFVIHKPRMKSGLLLRGGLARLVAFSYVCKMYGLKDWLGFLEIYGIPLRLGKYGPGANEEDKAVLKSAVANIGSDAAAILPDSMVIEFEQIAQASGASDVFARLVEWIDRQVSKAVLGQTATTEGTPGKLGNEDAQDAVRQDLIEADARQLSNTLNRDLIRPFIDLNFGPQKVYPKVVIAIPEKEDIDALATNLEKLVPLGLKVSAQEVRAKLGLSEPASDADLLGVPAAPEPEPTKPDETEQAENHRKALNRATPDDIDQIAQVMLDDWEGAQRITDPILEAVKSANSYEEVLALLPQLLSNADPTLLTHSLANAGLMAFGEGREGDE